MYENFTKTEETKDSITFSLINTKQCNFACSYCYESDKFENKQYTKENIDEIYNFLKLNNAKKISLTMIGGEPTLSINSPYLFELLAENAEKDNIELEKITLITNGYSFELIKKFFPETFLQKYKDKIMIQISYDGRKNQDKFRVVKKGNDLIGSSKQVLDTIERCFEFGFDTVIKSTLTLGGFEYVEDTLIELRELNLYYQKKFNDKKVRFFYAVTEAKESIEKIPHEFIKDTLKKYIPGILKQEAINIKILKTPLTKWLRNAKYNSEPVDCLAGIKLFSINTEMELEYCHHASYLNVPKNENKMIYGNLKEEESIEKMKKNQRELVNNIHNKPEHPCDSCEAVYCLKCPIHTYEQLYINKKTNELDKIYLEFESDSLCFYFKELSKYLHAFNKQYKIFK